MFVRTHTVSVDRVQLMEVPLGQTEHVVQAAAFALEYVFGPHAVHTAEVYDPAELP